MITQFTQLDHHLNKGGSSGDLPEGKGSIEYYAEVYFFIIAVIIFTVILIVTILGSIHTELHWFLGCRAQGWLWRDVLEGR